MKFYDLPISFALNLREMKEKGEDTHIIDEVPEMFEGLDMKGVCKVLDLAGVLLDNSCNGEVKIDMEGREFKFSWLDCGAYGDVYKITSEGYPPLALKLYSYPKGVGIHGPFGEIAIERELTRAGVVDVPKFYMASPLGDIMSVNNGVKHIPYASWKISEFITEDTPKKEGNMTLAKFLLKRGLSFHDKHQKNYIGNYWVDLGAIVGQFGSSFYGNYGFGNACPIIRMIDNPKFYKEFSKNDEE